MDLIRVSDKDARVPTPSLDTAVCTVHLDLRRNHLLIDRVALDAKLTKETVESLQSYGINVVAGPTETQLGGIDSIGDILSNLGLLLALVKLPLELYRRYLRHMTNVQLPAVNVCLTLNDNGEVSPDDLSQRVSTLAQAAHTETKRLQAKYPMYLFGSFVSVDLSAYSFNAHFSLPAHKNSLFNHRRMMRVIDSLKFQEGLILSVSVNNAGLIVHEVAPQTLILDSPHHKKDWRQIAKSKKFYTFLSSRMFGGYTRGVMTMPYKQYHDK